MSLAYETQLPYLLLTEAAWLLHISGGWRSFDCFSYGCFNKGRHDSVLPLQAELCITEESGHLCD